MLALLAIISPHLILSQNLYCADSACKLCTSGYNYQNISCLDQCPTKFSQTGLSCLNTDTDKALYIAEFLYEKIFTKTCIGVFCHPFGLPLNDQARVSPITTMDRGFYFSSTSRLTSTPAWILAPDMSLGIMIAIATDGTIFEARLSNSLVLKIEAKSSNLFFSILLYSSGSLQTRTKSIVFTYNTWSLFRFIHYQFKGSSTLKILANTVETISYNNHEFRLQDPTINYYLGSSQSDSFQGFLAKFIIQNSILQVFNILSAKNCFDYNSFYNGTACNSCPSNCSTWPWCISESCNLCYSDNCNSCTGYTYSSCTSCSNNNIAPGCDIGRNCQQQTSTFSCTLCSSGVLISGICVNTPYKYPSDTPVIDITFNKFNMLYGGIFKSGSDQSTWGPDHNPEMDDPIPLKDRGLYFNGNLSYLEAKSDILLSPTSTIALWAHPMNNGYIYYKPSFSFGAYLVFTYVLYNSMAKSSMIITDSANQKRNTWLFIVISNNLVSGISSFTISVQMLTIKSYSVDGYAMYEISSSIMPRLGNSVINDFPYQGYLYSFTIWQNHGVDVSSRFDICGKELISSCLSSCLSTSYFNTYQGICLPCNESCTQGCLSWGTCQKCADIKCNYCSDYVSPCT